GRPAGGRTGRGGGRRAGRGGRRRGSACGLRAGCGRGRGVVRTARRPAASRRAPRAARPGGGPPRGWGAARRRRGGRGGRPRRSRRRPAPASGRLAATSLLAVRGPRDTSLRGCAPTLPGGREFRHLSIKNRQRLRQTDVGGSDRVFARAESPFRG